MIPYEKIKELSIFKSDPETLVNMIMKTYEIRKIYEDPEKRLIIHIDECIQKAIQTSLIDCTLILEDILKYIEPKEAKQQLEKCMNEIGKIKAERCKAIGTIPTPKS